MIWATMPSGRANPLNVEEVKPEAGKGVVAYNPATGGGIPVIGANVPGDVERWAAAGATYHASHFATCPRRGEFKREHKS